MLRQSGRNILGLDEVSSIANATEVPNNAPGERRKKLRKKGIFRKFKRVAKRRWRYIGVAGVTVLLLAALLLCLLAFLERWGNDELGKSVIANESGTSTTAPVTEMPQFFDDRPIPKILSDYTDKHNKITADPDSGRYLIYEIPTDTTLPNSLLGLTSAFLLAILSERALLVEWTEDYEAPGPSDLGGGAGDWEYSFNTSSSPHSNRRSSLDEIFLNPGFWWDWKRFLSRWSSRFEKDEADIVITTVNVGSELEQLVCGDLSHWRSKDQFVKVTDVQYFAPALAVNVHHRNHLLSEIPSIELFSYLSNWLLRPVPSVMMAVRRFSERYFSNNFVIGMEMSLSQSFSEWGTMSETQQKLFFKEASEATYRASQQIELNASNSSSVNQGIMVLVVTDDEEALRSRLKGQAQDTLGSAGIIAITGPRGVGTKRILTELQELWLLGHSDLCIVSGGSALGIFGYSRTGISPIVVTESLEAHHSTLSQPCYDGISLLEHVSCFNPNMLLEFEMDSAITCKSERRQQRRRVQKDIVHSPLEISEFLEIRRSIKDVGLWVGLASSPWTS